ncbi:MAG: hypothetical protein H6664_10495 [Ardenticatenaceae bacterium]|nr:hypothetical protein [Ardenticatenaceae bacterium]
MMINSKQQQNEKPLFVYQHQKAGLTRIVAAFLLLLLFSCFLAIIGLVGFSLLAEQFFDFQPAPFVILWVWGFITLSLSFRSNIITYLTINSDQITFRKFPRKEFIIAKTEIKNVTWKGFTINLQTNNSTYKINLNQLPEKERIQANHAFMRWLPPHVLPDQILSRFRRKQAKLELLINAGEQEVKTATHWWAARVLRIVIILLWVIFVTGSLIALQTTSLYKDVTFIIAFFTLFLSVSSWGIWNSTISRIIYINTEGITYQKGQKFQHFAWQEIDAIRVNPRQQWIFIWVGQRYKTVPYSRINHANLTALFLTIDRYTYQHDIATAIY